MGSTKSQLNTLSHNEKESTDIKTDKKSKAVESTH